MFLMAAKPITRLANVTRVHDGDTIAIHLSDWAEDLMFMPKYARLFGYDAPELLDKRPEVSEIAKKARDEVKAICGKAKDIVLLNIRGSDKYGERILCDISIEGTDLGKHLLALGLVRPYNGRGAKPWTAK